MRARPSTRRATELLLLLIVAVSLGAYLIFGTAPLPPPIAGLVRVTEIKIAPEISGRLKLFRAASGDVVQRGDVITELENPELAAAVAEAEATVDQAKAARDRVYAGLRREEVDILEHDIDKAHSDLMYAQQQLRRVGELNRHNNASRQNFDLATAEVARDRARLALADARHAAGLAGPTREERHLADVKLAASQATLEVLERRLEKATLRAPVDGTVQVLVAEPGEAIVPGQPVMTIYAAHERWFSFDVREDKLKGLDVGAEVDLVDGRKNVIPAHITEIRGLGEFATWRAARAVGDHDLNTLRVRCDPLGTVALEPGMTVWLPR